MLCGQHDADVLLSVDHVQIHFRVDSSQRDAIAKMTNKRVRRDLHLSQTDSVEIMQCKMEHDDDLSLMKAHSINSEVRSATPQQYLLPTLAEDTFDQAFRLYQAGHFAESVRILANAVHHQHRKSYALLSTILCEGRNGVPRDVICALKLATAGVALGCTDCKGLLGLHYTKGYGVSADEAKGFELGIESAASGSCYGQFLVGLCYMWGLGVSEDKHEAVRLWRLAANQGNALAQTNLAYMLENGEAVAQDKVEAVRLYRLASQQGVATAQYNLAGMLEHGTGVAKDTVEAVRFYRLAVEQGHFAALNNLGAMFENGHGVAPNRDEAALLLYCLSAAQGNLVARSNLLNMISVPRVSSRANSIDRGSARTISSHRRKVQPATCFDSRYSISSSFSNISHSVATHQLVPLK
jgi:TPR repeat protein